MDELDEEDLNDLEEEDLDEDEEEVESDKKVSS